MFRLVPLLLILTLVACTPALTPQEREAANEKNLLRLVQISLTERLRPQLEASYRQQVASIMPADSPPPEATEKIVNEEINAALDAKMADLDMRLAAIFASRFTPEDIRQLLAFHESEVGRKSMANSAEMAVESREAIQEWSQDFEQDLFERLSGRLSKEGMSL